MLCMLRIAACLFGAAIAFVSYPQATSAQKAAVTGKSALKNRIAPANPAKYRSIRDGQDWKNPYLIVQAKCIDAVSLNPATKILTMAPADVVAYLEKLPSSAWPYGLVVAVQEAGIRAGGHIDDAPIKKNLEELVRLLEKAGVKVELWPSA
jgi:hypothetical protein